MSEKTLPKFFSPDDVETTVNVHDKLTKDNELLLYKATVDLLIKVGCVSQKEYDTVRETAKIAIQKSPESYQ